MKGTKIIMVNLHSIMLHGQSIQTVQKSLDPESNRGPTDNRFTLQSAALPTELSREGISSMGLEPTTLGLLDPRSNQLSYEDVGRICSLLPNLEYIFFLLCYLQAHSVASYLTIFIAFLNCIIPFM